MAAALTHYVKDYMKSRGSPVYISSLDAEGTFDGILSHSILFKKALGVIPDMYLCTGIADLLYKLNREIKLVKE